MKEVYEFRINKEFSHLLLKEGEGRENGSNIIFFINRSDPRFETINDLNRELKEKYNKSFYLYSNIKRTYSRTELDRAHILHLIIKTTFEPTGEECDTEYDEFFACKICGANRRQIGSLKLKKGSIPSKDISRTLGGEIVVSHKFSETIKKFSISGIILKPIEFIHGLSNYYQLFATSEVELSNNTIAGVNIFDHSEKSEVGDLEIKGGYNVKFEKEIYKCPNGDTIGLNLLSEVFVRNLHFDKSDFCASKQKIGVKRGMLRPEPIYLCSQKFREMVILEKLSGFDFEVAHLEK